MRRRTRPFVLSFIIISLTGARQARADYEDTYFPLNAGNEWVYEESGFGASPAKVRMRVAEARTFSGRRWFKLEGYNGNRHWVRQTLSTGRVYEWQNRTWYRLGAAQGTTWTFSIRDSSAGSAIPGSNGAQVEVLARDETITVPAGTFRTIHLRFKTQVADAGIAEEWLAKGVGLVRRTEQTIGGPRAISLERAVVSGQTYPSAGATGGIVSALKARYFGIEGNVAPSRVTIRTILANHLDRPTAAQENPRDGSLWIVNRGDDSSVVVDAAGTAQQVARKYRDDSAHFMNNPMAIAFSRTRDEFATIQDTGNDYNGAAPPNNFMGPTLWTANRAIYEGGASSHLDMLHHSPYSVGIAAGERVSGVDRREYWVFNGQTGCIDRYFFNDPHELGGHDHLDGLTYRYGSGLRRVAGVPGHLALDTATGKLYIADTGNGRIAKVDTRVSITGAQKIAGLHDETPLFRVPGAVIEPVTGQGSGLVQPAGLLLKDGALVVSDHATGRIKVFGTDGTLKGDVDTGLGAQALSGLAETRDGRLFFLDMRGNRLLELVIAP